MSSDKPTPTGPVITRTEVTWRGERFLLRKGKLTRIGSKHA